MGNFTQVSNEILCMDISAGALKLYMNLLKRCFGDKDYCFPSEDTLAKELKKSVRTVQRYLKELVKSKLIEIKRRGSTSNLYKVLEKTKKSVEKKVMQRVQELKKKNADAYVNKENDKAKDAGEFNEVKNTNMSVEELNNVENEQKFMYSYKKKRWNNSSKNVDKSYSNKGNYKKESLFNNFEQRNYDFAKLEAALLGWDTSIKYEDCLIK